MTRESISQPMYAPAAAGGGVIAGISAAVIALFTIGDCFAFQTRRGECRETMQVSVPAVVAGVASVFAAWGGYWTRNPRLHANREEPRRRDEHGRFMGD